MKRTPLIIIVFCITVVSFLIFTADSFSKATVIKQKDGPIYGLVIEFDDPGLPVLLPGYDENITINSIEIIAKGKEHIVITPSNKFNYHADMTGDNDGYDAKINGEYYPLTLISATLDEHYTIEGDPDEVPYDKELYFKSTWSITDPTNSDIVYTFSFDLKLKHGQVQIIRYK